MRKGKEVFFFFSVFFVLGSNFGFFFVELIYEAILTKSVVKLMNIHLLWVLYTLKYFIWKWHLVVFGLVLGKKGLGFFGKIKILGMTQIKRKLPETFLAPRIPRAESEETSFTILGLILVYNLIFFSTIGTVKSLDFFFRGWDTLKFYLFFFFSVGFWDFWGWVFWVSSEILMGIQIFFLLR